MNIRRRKVKPSEVFRFDRKLELTIYKYLCDEKINSGNWKKIKDKYEFISYADWSKYIYNKYEVYNIDSLNEFIKYLDFKLGKQKLFDDFGKVTMYPAAITISINMLMNVTDYLEKPVLFSISALVLLYIVMKCILEDKIYGSIEYNMYKDYKKEITNLIETKK